MPLGYGAPVFTSSAGGDIGAGKQYTRLRGPVFLGSPRSADSPGGGSLASANPPFMLNVSTQLADICLVPTTFASTAGVNVSTGTPTGLVWISQSTGAGNLVQAGSTANAPSPLIGGAHAAAICWDSAYKTLSIYDPASSAWLIPHSASSGAGAVITWSASSS